MSGMFCKKREKKTFNMMENSPFYLAELEKMRKQMEEDIRAQLMANQAMLADNEESWNEKVRNVAQKEDSN